LKYQEKCKQITILDWLKKKMNFILFWYCKWLLFHELYCSQLMKKWVLLFWKCAKKLSIIILHKLDFNNEQDQGSEKYKPSVFLCFPRFYTFLILQFFSKVYMMM
jgi:hypothetical protein